MSNVYGLQIDDVGIEFPSREDRDKAILTFTRGSSVAISTYGGPRFKPAKGAFSTYERDPAQQQANCENCHGIFLAETCPQRTVPERGYKPNLWPEGETETRFLCDGCHARYLREKELHDAKKVVEAAEAV